MSKLNGAAETLSITAIPNTTGRDFVAAHHYAVICPPITKITYGLFKGEKLVGVALWGFGTRPMHTIRRLFPSLGVNNYLELNRFCVLDEMPRNTESMFLKLCGLHIEQDFPCVHVLFSWADGLRGKPGYVYQSANWLYGGFIKSQFYCTADGEVVHPRLLITRYGTRANGFTRSIGLTKISGFQFRYCKFMCSHKIRKALLKESPFNWRSEYPKKCDLKWWIDAEEGSRESFECPTLKGSGRFRHSAGISKGDSLWA
ncbi:MAG: hypothetical protein A2270_10575 [Elusimicrobia bacterium RIFOXYA12_FULL_51_18]|nr:MAG: hypothetical protein A2270_10575 [Elusimicrobia bacterium RIFOXYA12_FULL_51_18]OGS29491.1 MAG: hypothetical protein A2218_00615 [Elusimicrobia bacterium RIFOXYA2_FULL_53_38]